MSWSAEYTTLNGVDIVFVGDDTPESKAAMKKSVAKVDEIIKAGVLGDPAEKSFAVRIAGHANPGNEPREGFMNDYVHINIFQMQGDNE